MFYKNKIKKQKKNQYFYRSAIDNAVRYNQMGAIEIILKYIVQYQNVYSSSFLFRKNLGIILDKGIKI